MKISKALLVYILCSSLLGVSIACADGHVSDKVKMGTFPPDQVSISLMKKRGDDIAWVKVELPDGEFQEPPGPSDEAKSKAKRLYAVVQSCKKKKHMIDFFETDGKRADLEDSGHPVSEK